jgi:hypothetical protein
MSLDDKPTGGSGGSGDGEEEAPWNPDDDRLERKYLKKVIEMMERAIKREDDSEQARSDREAMLRARMDQAARGAARGIAARVPSPHDPSGGAPLIVVRPIENGFIVSFLEITKAGITPGPVPVPPGTDLPPDAVVVGSVISFKRIEAFVSDAAAVVPYMERAMKSLREMEKAEA